jgi:hypothetical protein
MADAGGKVYLALVGRLSLWALSSLWADSQVERVALNSLESSLQQNAIWIRLFFFVSFSAFLLVAPLVCLRS